MSTRQVLPIAGVFVTGALAATASSGAVGTPAPAQRATGGAAAYTAGPVASLRPAHRRVVVGKRLLLDASHSTDASGRIVDYRWDLNGDGVFEKSTGAKAHVRHAFRKPGRVRVAVAVVDDKGDRAIGYAKVRALAAVHRETVRHPRVHSATKHAKRKAPAKPHSAGTPTIRFAANAGSVTIKNFAFSPKSITVKVGDSVTWTNQDAATHNAVAND